ncbi:MAG: hypothetical protein Q9186_007395 [Xanthomendoza sp. 1 TL-2023]
MPFITPSTSENKDKTSSGYQNSKEESHAAIHSDTSKDSTKKLDEQVINEDDLLDIANDFYEKLRPKKGGGKKGGATKGAVAAKIESGESIVANESSDKVGKLQKHGRDDEYAGPDKHKSWSEIPLV